MQPLLRHLPYLARYRRTLLLGLLTVVMSNLFTVAQPFLVGRAVDELKAGLDAMRLDVDATPEMTVMQEEIFGPLLPVMGTRDATEAIAFINRRDRPLALYWFGNNAKRRERVLRETIAGGVTVNDTLLHFAHEDLPFGGIGDSGSGAYHGERSFALFSNEKAVFHQSRISPAKLLWPPYGKTFERLFAIIRRL